MHSLQNVEVLRQMAAERQAQLREAGVRVAREGTHPVRLWIGRRIVELGAWIAREPVLATAWSR